MNQHPLQPGQVFSSPGCCYTYRILGSCCRLFDREELPYPCCRLEWRGKEPSWRRIGRRLVPDIGARSSPSYVVEILGQEKTSEPFVVTFYWFKLSPELREWWYSRKAQPSASSPEPLAPAERSPSALRPEPTTPA